MDIPALDLPNDWIEVFFALASPEVAGSAFAKNSAMSKVAMVVRYSWVCMVILLIGIYFL